MNLFRLVQISWVAWRFGLDEVILASPRTRFLRGLFRMIFFWRNLAAPRAQRLRQALESLGPLFVKFGQMLSTRRDLLPADFADELARLQDQVPPFEFAEVEKVLQAAYGRPWQQVFRQFDPRPVASASVAQVHFAELCDGHPVAVKVLRPGISTIIQHDLALLDAAAILVEKLFADGKRLHPREVVDEFRKTLRDQGVALGAVLSELGLDAGHADQAIDRR